MHEPMPAPHPKEMMAPKLERESGMRARAWACDATMIHTSYMIYYYVSTKMAAEEGQILILSIDFLSGKNLEHGRLK